MKSIFYFIGLSILMACYRYPVWPKDSHDHQERQEITLSASEAQRMLEQARKDNIALIEQNLELKKSYQTLQAIMKRQAEIIDYLLNSVPFTPYHIQQSKESRNSTTSSSISNPFKFLPSSQKYFRRSKIEDFSSLVPEVQKDKFLDVKISLSLPAKLVPLGHKAPLLDFQGAPNSCMPKVNFFFQPSLGSLRETSPHYLSRFPQEIERGLPKNKSYEAKDFTHKKDDLNEESTNLHRNHNVQDEHPSNHQDLRQKEKQAYKNLQKRLHAANQQNYTLSQENSSLKDENQSLLAQIDLKFTAIKEQETLVSTLQAKLSSRVKEQEILERQLSQYASTVKSFYETIHALTQYFEVDRIGNDLEKISKQSTRGQELSLEDINDYLNNFSSTAVSILPLATKKMNEGDAQPLP